MTQEETIAFNAGVSAVLALTHQAAAGVEPLIVAKATRYNCNEAKRYH